MATNGKIREPKQERSIETKKKIINAGYEVFSSVGFYGTNTAEIAKAAGVSTGIVYGYFKDKRDILLCVLDIYIDNVTEPLYSLLADFTLPIGIEELAPAVVDEVIKIHENNSRIHNTLHSLAATDDGVNARFSELEHKMTTKLSAELNELGINKPDMFERVHLAMNIVQSFAHEYVFDKHQYIDYPKMRNIVCNIIIKLFA